MRHFTKLGLLGGSLVSLTIAVGASAQEVDRFSAPNAVGVGMAKGIAEQLGSGTGNAETFGSSRYLIARDPARAIRRGRNLFQRKFKHSEGAGPRTQDGTGDINTIGSLGAGLADSCALCHGRPRGAAGFGGDVFTRPDSRDAPHLFGLGIQEQLADEITSELRAIRDDAIATGCDPNGGGQGGTSALAADDADLWNVQDGSGGSIADAPGGGINVTAGSGWTIVRSDVVGPLGGVHDSIDFVLDIPSGAPTWGIVSAVVVAPGSGVWWGQLDQIALGSLNIGGSNNISLSLSGALQAALDGDPQASINIIVMGNPGDVFRFDNVDVADTVPGGTGGGGSGCPLVVDLVAKGVNYGTLSVDENGVVDTSGVEGVNEDLRVRPFFAEGTTVSMREFIVGAANAEMGLQITDSVIDAGAAGDFAVSPSGMVFDGALDSFESSPLPETTDPDATEPNAPGLGDDAGEAMVDFMEFYLLNYFKPGHYEETDNSIAGRALFNSVGCNDCHKADFTIDSDRRVADVETNHRSFFAPEDQPPPGVFNNLFAVASPRFEVVDGSQDELNFPLIVPQGESFLVEDIFTDFKRHDLGTPFHERNFDNTIHTTFITEPLWGVGSSAPYGHDGRSINLQEVILRHAGEAADARDDYAALSEAQQGLVRDFLGTLILFPPDDTASNLNLEGQIDPSNPDYPQRAHGNIRLPTLFQIEAEGAE